MPVRHNILNVSNMPNTYNGTILDGNGTELLADRATRAEEGDIHVLEAVRRST